ncbi:MAG TPA: AcvB/VirJ family lysyl-phosphatidylglycerol hydrolase [Thermoanaerobaculia bacterium]|nr:AcvB/VirJ family lysyl-phosphatidylglycerol hydrolase [Thermoanaerobaculia bacterium]
MLRSFSLVSCLVLLAGATRPAAAASLPSAASSREAASRPAASRPAVAPPGQTFSYGRFGQVTVYRPAGTPEGVVLFVSGDGGWNLGVVDMANHLKDWGALVVGIDIRSYLKSSAAAAESCTDAAADFDALARFAEGKVGYQEHAKPILVGYSSGATLVYAAIVQAKPGVFQGAISLGFCPDLLVKKPFCAGHGLTFVSGVKGKGTVFDPGKHLEDPWFAFQGSIDQVCDPQATADYLKAVRNGELVWLDKVGHGFSVERRWLPQFKESYLKLAR